MARVTTVLVVVASLAIGAPAARAAGGSEVPAGAQVRATAKHAIVYPTRPSVHAWDARGELRSADEC